MLRFFLHQVMLLCVEDREEGGGEAAERGEKSIIMISRRDV